MLGLALAQQPLDPRPLHPQENPAPKLLNLRLKPRPRALAINQDRKARLELLVRMARMGRTVFLGLRAKAPLMLHTSCHMKALVRHVLPDRLDCLATRENVDQEEIRATKVQGSSLLIAYIFQASRAKPVAKERPAKKVPKANPDYKGILEMTEKKAVLERMELATTKGLPAPRERLEKLVFKAMKEFPESEETTEQLGPLERLGLKALPGKMARTDILERKERAEDPALMRNTVLARIEARETRPELLAALLVVKLLLKLLPEELLKLRKPHQPPKLHKKPVHRLKLIQEPNPQPRLKKLPQLNPPQLRAPQLNPKLLHL